MICKHKEYGFVSVVIEFNNKENCQTVIRHYICSDCEKKGSISRIEHVCNIVWGGE